MLSGGIRGFGDTSPSEAGSERKRKLCRASARFFLVVAADEELGDLHQVVGQDSDANKYAEAVVAASQTTLHSAAAEEYGNAAFNAGTEALRLFELRTFFKSLTFSRFLSAALGNAGASDRSEERRVGKGCRCRWAE